MQLITDNKMQVNSKIKEKFSCLVKVDTFSASPVSSPLCSAFLDWLYPWILCGAKMITTLGNIPFLTLTTHLRGRNNYWEADLAQNLRYILSLSLFIRNSVTELARVGIVILTKSRPSPLLIERRLSGIESGWRVFQRKNWGAPSLSQELWISSESSTWGAHTWIIFCCFTKTINGELDWKWSTHGTNWYPYGNLSL